MRGGVHLVAYLLLVSCLRSTRAVRCDREPPGHTSLKSEADNRFKIKISGNPDKYVPGEVYTEYLPIAVQKAMILQLQQRNCLASNHGSRLAAIIWNSNTLIVVCLIEFLSALNRCYPMHQLPPLFCRNVLHNKRFQTPYSHPTTMSPNGSRLAQNYQFSVQVSAPVYRPMLQYSWQSAGHLNPEQVSDFKNVIQVAFDFSPIECDSEDCSGKAWRALHFIMRILRKASPKSREIAYLTLVRPLKEYGTTCWDPYRIYQINSLERIQYRAAKFVKGKREDGNDTIKELKWETLENKRSKTRITSLYRAHLGQKAWVDITARLEKPTYYGRNDHDFKIKYRKQKTDVGQKYSTSLVIMKKCVSADEVEKKEVHPARGEIRKSEPIPPS
ncbi:hypothetical protein ANN_02286 [Periplaneta americana]|uniref:Uncharacterized protein n=1 Tax=Periplaneta americana TaxID=6978 RepID=A0ABQ8U025_PERAM|nr:hypothetical protein ANN_02286 [Periplaneta americana]